MLSPASRARADAVGLFQKYHKIGFKNWCTSEGGPNPIVIVYSRQHTHSRNLELGARLVGELGRWLFLRSWPILYSCNKSAARHEAHSI